MKSVQLAKYNNSWYSPKAGTIKQLLWYFVNALFIKNYMMPLSGVKVALLRLFGAKIGAGVVIKPGVNVKYPWLLTVGSHTWIGENVWIDNLCEVSIGSNACLSQGAMLLTGNHDFKKETFDLIVKEIVLEDGAWVGAQCVVCPGVTCGTHSVLTVGSVATANLEPYGIYKGNPAIKIKMRNIE
jgi:putative colanic acid biosynthesis acetyltransferase WcaF